MTHEAKTPASEALKRFNRFYPDSFSEPMNSADKLEKSMRDEIRTAIALLDSVQSGKAKVFERGTQIPVIVAGGSEAKRILHMRNWVMDTGQAISLAENMFYEMWDAAEQLPQAEGEKGDKT